MIIRIIPDKEKVSSMLELIKDREEFVSTIDIERFPTIAAEGYYEVIKELASALLLLDGIKAIGENAHKDMIDHLSNYKEILENEIMLINDLRIKRNRSSYEGKKIETDYLRNRKEKLIVFIEKLEKMIKKKL